LGLLASALKGIGNTIKNVASSAVSSASKSSSTSNSKVSGGLASTVAKSVSSAVSTASKAASGVSSGSSYSPTINNGNGNSSSSNSKSSSSPSSAVSNVGPAVQSIVNSAVSAARESSGVRIISTRTVGNQIEVLHAFVPGMPMAPPRPQPSLPSISEEQERLSRRAWNIISDVSDRAVDLGLRTLSNHGPKVIIGARVATRVNTFAWAFAMTVDKLTITAYAPAPDPPPEWATECIVTNTFDIEGNRRRFVTYR